MISKEVYDKVQAKELLTYDEYVQIIETAEEEKAELADQAVKFEDAYQRSDEAFQALKDEFNKVSKQRDTLIRVIEKIMKEV